MLFNVEQDLGGFVSGYVVGDGFEETCRIAVTHAGAVVYEGLADAAREAIMTSGRHRTGLCGFQLDEANLPGLGAMEDLEIREPASGVLIYRRLRPQHTLRRVLRLETHLFPLWRLDNAVNPKFQYYANRIEGFTRETTAQMFLLNRISSVYLSGRLLYRAYQHQIEGQFDVLFTMHQPYEELAERLIVLAQIKNTGLGILGLRENMSLEPTMVFAQSLPVEDDRKLALALRQMPKGVARVLSNPVTRQLTTLTPDEMPAKAAVGRALATLSSFAGVGLRRAPKVFGAALSGVCGLDTPPPDTTPLPGVSELAELLRRTREAEWLIDQDLALYGHVADAYGAADDAVPDAARTV